MQLDRFYQDSLNQYPDKVTLIIDDLEVTFRQLEDLADLYARTLAGLGIEQGDRVAFFMGNRQELAALYLACFKLGAVAVPTSWFNKTPEVAYELGHCQAKLLITEPELFDSVRHLADELPTLQRVYQLGQEPDDPGQSWARATEQAVDAVPAPTTSPDDPAVILYTSGSTGRAKGVTHTVASLGHLTANRIAALEHTSDDKYFITSYLCHGSALTSVFLPMLAVGGTTILVRHSTPELFLEVLRRRRPTVAASAPSQAQEILDQPSLTREDFASMRYMHVGGDAASLDLFGPFLDKTGLELSIAMGMTECGGYLLSPLHGPVKRGSLGKPIQGTEIRLIDDQGQDVPPGEIGQMIVRAGSMMRGYWDDPDNTADAIRDGWLYTGDLAYCDPDGFYFFMGRSKHIIIRGGGNISPVEVEDFLNSHPKVKISGVVGIPDEKMGQAVMALVVPRSAQNPPSEQELTEYAQASLADRKVPGRWALVKEMPLTPMSKIDRKALAKVAQEILAGEDKA